MFVHQGGNCFQLYDDLSETNVIRLIDLGQGSSAIAEDKRWFADCRNLLVLKLDAQTFLINGLEKAAPLLIVDFEAGANNRVALFLVCWVLAMRSCSSLG